MSDEHEVRFGNDSWSLLRVQEGARLLWLCVVTPEAQTYVYIPDSGRFHLNHGVYGDYIWDHELTYVPVSVDEARELIAAQVGLLSPGMPSDQRRRLMTGEQLEVDGVLALVEKWHRRRGAEFGPGENPDPAGAAES